MILKIVVMIAIASMILLGYLIADRIYTWKKLEENQIAWDEFSKDMAFDEKLDVYLEWCEERKAKTGNSYYYFPRIEG